MDAIIGRKLGMSQLVADDGTLYPVTVIAAGPCPVIQVRPAGPAEPAGVAGAAGAAGASSAAAGRRRASVQLGFEQCAPRRASKARTGHAARAGLEAAPRVLREFAFDHPAPELPAAGSVVTVALFQPGERVKVTARSKGRGFQGVVHRHGFHGGPASHGSTRYRKPGSVGPGTFPSRVIKGKKMPGQMGSVRRTALNLLVCKVDAERNLLFVRGAVPGSVRGIVTVRKQAS